MGIETKTKTIGDISFEVTQLQYFRAQRLFVRLVKLAGPALLGLAQLAGAGNGKAAMGALLGLDVDRLVPVLAGLFEQLAPDVVENLTREILSGARGPYDGKTVILVNDGPAEKWPLNLVLGGDFWTGMALQGWALSVHFGNFSGARAALEAAGLKLKASVSPESTTSTDGKAAP